jgi:succinate dehydrogenase / fumarate reductase cytochrome b subunit
MLYCVAYFLGNLAIPGAILAGCAKPDKDSYAAQHMPSSACCPAPASTSETK